MRKVLTANEFTSQLKRIRHDDSPDARYAAFRTTMTSHEELRRLLTVLWNSQRQADLTANLSPEDYAAILEAVGEDSPV